MCIRDRVQTLKAPAALDVDENNQIKGIYVTPQMISSIKDGRASIKPTGEEDVSYTHLDVYKRQVKKISAVIDETQVVEGDLRREIALNIKRLQEIGCYRGIRLSLIHI